MEEQNVLVKNLQTSYKIFGQNKPFLILHGWPSSSEKWQQTASLLAEKGFMPIVPDLPGFGKSQQPSQAWSLDNYVEWLLEFSEKVPELQKGFFLLGHSFGGAIAAKFAIKYNQKVEKLFLVSAACVRKRTWLKKLFYHFAQFIKIFSFLPHYENVRKGFYKFVLRKSDYSHVSGVMKDTYLKVISEDLSHKIGFIKTPTVIIWGDKDDLTPLKQAKFIQGKIKNSVLVVAENQGHSIQLADPELLAEKISANLKNDIFN